MVACATPTVDGTEIDSSEASSGKHTTKRPSRATSGDDDDGAASPTPSGTHTTPMTDTTAVPTATTTATATSSAAPPPPPTTTATTPPPVTQPNCQFADPIQCLSCCLDANPAAVPYEDDYDFCMQGCDPADDACFDFCQSQHVSQCAANTSCAKNHACMEANNCLAQNFCNPI